MPHPLPVIVMTVFFKENVQARITTFLDDPVNSKNYDELGKLLRVYRYWGALQDEARNLMAAELYEKYPISSWVDCLEAAAREARIPA